MNIAKLTNKIAVGAIVVLLYWVFIFICTVTFGFKVLRQNSTEMFMLSIFGIFAILCAAIALNIMHNLTTIAGKYKETKTKQKSYKIIITASLFVLSLVGIFLILYFGDLATSQKKENYFVNSAQTLLEEQMETIEALSDYKFSKEYVKKAMSNIKFLSKIDENFPSITVIHQDTINGKKVLLGFQSGYYIGKDKEIEKVDFILSTSKEERSYLYSVFFNNISKYKFSSYDGRYEIYYPVKTKKGIFVLYLSQYNRYGKLGS